MVTADERAAIRGAAEELQPETVAFLQEMIRTPSVNPPGDYADVHELVASRYEEHGWEVETVWAPDDLVAELGFEHPRPNVLAYASRGDGPTIALNAHLDTVPVDESGWTYDPFGAEIDDGRVWGRGARDSKGRIAAYTQAARALEAADLVPDATVVLAITADEEVGGVAGPEYVIESGALSPDYAIVEGNVERIEYASAGVLHMGVTVTGEGAHAGRPERGANAIVGAARVIAALDDYADRLEDRRSEVPGIEQATCTPATIEGGVKTNVVPASCSFTVDRRVLPEEDVDEAEREFRDVVAGIDLPAGVRVEVETILRANPFRSDPEAPHVRLLKRNADAVLGGDIPLQGTRGFTDARFFAQGGAETVKFGPGDERSNSHGADENLALDQLHDAAAVVAATIVDIAAEDGTAG